MTEMIDVLDENGVKTGRVATRDEVHREGLWHRIAAIMVVDKENRILLQQRSDDKLTNPGKWDIAAAGHVDAGEDSLTTIMREIGEEVGIEVDGDCSAADFRYLVSFRHEKSFEWEGERLTDRQFDDCFVLLNREIDVASLKLQESEVQAAKLCTLEEFKRMVAEGVLVNRKPMYDEVVRILEK